MNTATVPSFWSTQVPINAGRTISSATVKIRAAQAAAFAMGERSSGSFPTAPPPSATVGNQTIPAAPTSEQASKSAILPDFPGENRLFPAQPACPNHPPQDRQCIPAQILGQRPQARICTFFHKVHQPLTATRLAPCRYHRLLPKKNNSARTDHRPRRPGNAVQIGKIIRKIGL